MFKKIKDKWQRFKEWSTVDHWIDLFVDIGLIAFDVLSSPILIVVRFIRYFFDRFINEKIANFIKRIVHYFIDNRVIRLQRKQNVFRYYWKLWLLSPLLLFVIWMAVAFWIGVKSVI